MSQTFERCWAEIDLTALRANATLARRRVGPEVEIMAVVKANAYGHGMVEVAQALHGQVESFAVASLKEASQLRRAVSEPILILGPVLPVELSDAIARQFIIPISTMEELRACAAEQSGPPAWISLVIDTGMGRIGFLPDDFKTAARELSRNRHLRLHSIATHLPSAEDDVVFSKLQVEQFKKLLEECRGDLPPDYKTHAIFSAGVLSGFEPRLDLVRVGLMLYGSSAQPEFEGELHPVMTWKTRIALIRSLPAGRSISYERTFITPRPMRVATLAAGYADGYSRRLSNQGASVLIGGKRCAVLGRVTMDLTMADVTETEAEIGDEVVLMGRQGAEEIRGTELARLSGTIAWEILTGVGARVPRVYK